MKKLGIIVDSSAGLSQQEAEARGWLFLPLHLTINKKEYTDGKDISPEEYYETISVTDHVQTAATAPGKINEVLKKASKNFENVIVYTISKEISSQNQNVLLVANAFPNVYVVPSKAIGPCVLNAMTKAEQMSKENKGIKEIIKVVNEYNDSAFGLLVPKTLDWLVKGGRISPAVASLAKLTKIVPIIIFKDGKLDKYGRGRVFEKVVKKAILELESLNKKKKNNDHQTYMLNTGGDLPGELASKIEQKTGKKILKVLLPPVIGSHVGPGAICFFSTRKA